MKIGYACLSIGVPNAQMRTCRKKSATSEKLREIIENNLQATENMLLYNIENNILMYRLSSDLIPFGSDRETNSLDWVTLFENRFTRLGELVKIHQLRVSMHPGQYTVLNSPDENVVERAIEDLRYHNRVLDAMGLDSTHKIILHIGGAYGDKEAAIQRFVKTYASLSEPIKNRLIIENDDRLYTIEEVLKISELTGAPVVYDNLHHACNPTVPLQTDAYWIKQAKATWQDKDGPAKVHYSQQRNTGRLGAHTETIYIEPFMACFKEVSSLHVDIMLEVKDKNLSAKKCVLATSKEQNISHLEEEWARYKYLVLKHSPNHYQKIRNLLKNKKEYPVVAFYQLIEEALEIEPDRQVAMNALNHMWGHFKNLASPKEKNGIRYCERNIYRKTSHLIVYATG